MAKVDFNNLDDVESKLNNQNGNGADFSFFTLKNDNDEAVVRFMCDSTDDFDILTIHEVQVGGKYRKMSCIRDPREPLDRCPLCAANTRISNRFFIKMIQYVRESTPDGSQIVVPKATIWERSTNYAKTLKSYIDNYGPLSDIICKVIRHGKAGDMSTTYEIVPNLSKAVYPEEVYVKDPTLFNGIDVLGTVVIDRPYEDLQQFVMTGALPQKPKAEAQAAATDAGMPAEVTPRTMTQPVSPAPMAPQQPWNVSQPAPVAAPGYTQPSTATPAYAPQPAAGAPSWAPQTTTAAPQQPWNNGFGAPPTIPTTPAPATPQQPWNVNQPAGVDRPRRY